MRAEELRIGNIVNTNQSELVKITAVSPSFCWAEGDLLTLHDLELDKITPITLTEEWLFKFGAVKRYNELYELGKIVILENRNIRNNFIMMDIAIHIKIDYVHQLQNLYFALTGEELIIKK